MMSRGFPSALSARSRRSFTLFWAALFVLSLGLQYGSLASPPTARAATAPVVTLQSGTNECQGVLPTSGSANTNKKLVGGTLVPDGTAIFDITYPVDATDVGQTFEITDCVFIGGSAALKYVVSFVPNNTHYILEYTLSIPPGTLGDEYCNYAKTTQSPSDSPASNRKAGPACFLIGGNLSLQKVDKAGTHLAGAVFNVSCTVPTTTATLPALVIADRPSSLSRLAIRIPSRACRLTPTVESWSKRRRGRSVPLPRPRHLRVTCCPPIRS